ncbi:ATP-binding protein [Streptosporangium sp. NPDC000563]|uniref:ATP-binding protein n=1 Tax=Streptosporangium sp. NPDC000563 TaxID=3154366 RepID=UPI00332BF336
MSTTTTFDDVPDDERNTPQVQKMSDVMSTWAAGLSREAFARLAKAMESNVVPIVPTPEQEAREAAEWVRQQQARNRAMLWQRCLTGVYADYLNADLATLTAEQDPDGKVSGWLTSQSRTLLIAGENSRGKTHAAMAIGNQAAARQPLPMWVTAWNTADLDAALRPSADDPETVMGHACECDLLILDDLGAEKITEWTLEQLYRIVDARVRNHRKTIVTTNLPYDERGFADTPAEKRPVNPNLVGRYGHRITERLMHDATVVRVVGESWRKPVPW